MQGIQSSCHRESCDLRWFGRVCSGGLDHVLLLHGSLCLRGRTHRSLCRHTNSGILFVIAASTKQIEKRGHEINLLREIIDGMSTGTDKITEMTRWWHSVQEEIASLEACFTKPQWGSSAKLVYSMEDWRALEDRFNEYAEQLSKVSTNLERKLRTPSPTLVGSTTSTSSNRSSHRKVESDSVRVRRVGDTTKLSQPRRAIAVVNSSSLRAP